MIPEQPWALWHASTPPEAKVVLDRALQQHHASPDHPGYQWVRPVAEQRPPWLPTCVGFEPPWAALLQAQGDSTRVWTGWQRTGATWNYSTGVQAYPACLDHREGIGVCNQISFFLGEAPIYQFESVPAPGQHLTHPIQLHANSAGARIPSVPVLQFLINTFPPLLGMFPDDLFLTWDAQARQPGRHMNPESPLNLTEGSNRLICSVWRGVVYARSFRPMVCPRETPIDQCVRLIPTFRTGL